MRRTAHLLATALTCGLVVGAYFGSFDSVLFLSIWSIAFIGLVLLIWQNVQANRRREQ